MVQMNSITLPCLLKDSKGVKQEERWKRREETVEGEAGAMRGRTLESV